MSYYLSCLLEINRAMPACIDAVFTTVATNSSYNRQIKENPLMITTLEIFYLYLFLYILKLQVSNTH